MKIIQVGCGKGIAFIMGIWQEVELTNCLEPLKSQIMQKVTNPSQNGC